MDRAVTEGVNMGLDMYLYAVDPEVAGDRQVDVPWEELSPRNDLGEKLADTEIGYWRKFPELHGFIQRIYHRKGGSSEEFNCASVRLDKEDIIRIMQATIHKKLPKTRGFFFGDGGWPEDYPKTLKIMGNAIRLIEEKGKAIFYIPSW
jgi:hypothetical protein